MRRELLLHAFGNLTLLTKPLNSAISDGAFEAKRPEIAKQSKLRMNTYFQDFDNKDPWTEENIIKRGEELFEVARLVWPRPSSPG